MGIWYEYNFQSASRHTPDHGNDGTRSGDGEDGCSK